MTIETVTTFLSDHWRDGLEILILSTVFYYAYAYVRETRAARLFFSLVGVLVGLTFLSQVLDLPVVGFLVKVLALLLVVGMMVIFHPELRRALGDLGQTRLFSVAAQRAEFVERLDNVVRKLSSKRYGALFAIERRIDLKQYLETGVEIDGDFSDPLIMTLFHPKTALHDGGVILRGDILVGAGCVFPVSRREMKDRSIGLRHRAAIGLTEESDAIAVCVSEESGAVSIAHKGEIERDLDSEAFRARLTALLNVKKDAAEEEDLKEKRDGNTKSTKLDS